MKLTGHATPVMNSKYTHLQEKTLKDAVTTMPLFESPKPQDSATDEKSI